MPVCIFPFLVLGAVVIVAIQKLFGKNDRSWF